MTTDDDSTPGFRFTALSRFNDDVHLVNAPMDAVAYPTAYLTRCAKPVVAIYQDGRPATCESCLRATGDTMSSTTSSRQVRTGEHVK
jgi:hypothetical protein